MSDSAPNEQRDRPDRRRRTLPFWHPRRLHGRRSTNRRNEGTGEPYFVERISAPVFLMSSLLLVLTLIDGIFTIALLEADCVEANPVMRYLLDRGPVHFLVGKYLLTALFLPVSLVMNRYRLFGTRFRVGHLVPIVAGMYLVLIGYQLALWREHWELSGLTLVSPRAMPHPGYTRPGKRG
jgi:Domain of unknown function (DUF5658)